MEHAKTNDKNIAEALQLLEDSAKQKKDELKSVMSDKYTNLKNAVIEVEQGLVQSLCCAKNHAVDAAIQAKDVSVEKVREMASEADANVRRNPWAYIGGTAVVGLLLGYVLGRGRK